MSLRHALLAVLSAQPMTGYDVAKQFDGSVGYMWQAPHSQIYPELRRMEEAGFVEGEVLPRGERASKRRYRMTESGFQELERWLSSPPTYPPDRDIARLHTAYLDLVDREAATSLFRAHVRHYELLLQKWERMRTSIVSHSNDLIRRRLETRPQREHAAIVEWKAFAYDALIEKAQLEVAWAKRGLELVERLAADGVPDET